MKKVSVIMPVYNCERYISEAIESILGQTHSNFEFIIIDDCSTDGTGDIVRQYRDDRIRFFKNSANYGITATLNAALKYCSGSLIARMDGDDVAHFERLEKQVDFFEHHPEVGLLSSSYVVQNLLTGQAYKVTRHLSDTSIRFHMLFRNQFIHPGVMMRTKLMKSLKYNDVPTCEDYDLWMRAMSHSRIANLPDMLTFYRWHGENISIVNQPKMRKSMIFIISNILTEYEVDHDEQELLLQTMIALAITKKQLQILGKLDAMRLWLDKLTTHPSLTDRFGKEFVDQEIIEYKKIYDFY